MAKILIIEDDLRLAQMYQKILAFAGNEVAVAADGEEGLEKVKTEKPSLILLDVMLPKLNGLDVLEKLKADPETKNIPVIMLSNLGDMQNAEKAMELGAIKYIQKGDTDPQQVTDLIQEILGTAKEKQPEQSQQSS